ncbi:hypothetical protein [Pseudomonas sp. BNK-44-a]
MGYLGFALSNALRSSMTSAVEMVMVCSMRNHGGVVRSSAEGIPQPWMDELNDQMAMISDPEGRSAVMTEMAISAHRRQDIGAGALAEMLELAEAARLWAHAEREAE